MRTEDDNIIIYSIRYVKCLSQDSSVSIMITLRAGWMCFCSRQWPTPKHPGHHWEPHRILISATERTVPLDKATGVWSHIMPMLRRVELYLHRTRPPLPRVPSSRTWRQLLFEQDDLCVYFVVSLIGPAAAVRSRSSVEPEAIAVWNWMLFSPLTFRHRASRILGQAFRYTPENAFYIFNQQIYFIIWYFLDRASLI